MLEVNGINIDGLEDQLWSFLKDKNRDVNANLSLIVNVKSTGELSAAAFATLNGIITKYPNLELTLGENIEISDLQRESLVQLSAKRGTKLTHQNLQEQERINNDFAALGQLENVVKERDALIEQSNNLNNIINDKVAELNIMNANFGAAVADVNNLLHERAGLIEQVYAEYNFAEGLMQGIQEKETMQLLDQAYTIAEKEVRAIEDALGLGEEGKNSSILKKIGRMADKAYEWAPHLQAAKFVNNATNMIVTNCQKNGVELSQEAVSVVRSAMYSAYNNSASGFLFERDQEIKGMNILEKFIIACRKFFDLDKSHEQIGTNAAIVGVSSVFENSDKIVGEHTKRLIEKRSQASEELAADSQNLPGQ